ncbi:MULTISPECIES: hypothetical protein [Mycobacteriaceae]|uniref:Uncharacterized protein n=1 Tax=Mycolicibacterium parafortuitum TaxID=39692 RepID=A0ACC6MHX8_MYCPF|nr:MULTISPECIES: hypothetical protein [Mycobacteriaceae]MDZ5086488.1 hypothetical protein [Mycolicibacterium parafortuitum]GFM17123.1 uncharacterized protein PO1_contig-014-18 [Mycobacterium sp. PO1]GFM23416.1 uncharacterized protein PO2_contig-025-19 [Mycobacterium sp. PO2]
MAEMCDVTARLADGMPAVLTVQQYVAASAQVGYRHPDLTVHAGQLQDWYRNEDGMDLEALLHDCGVLEAAASAADEAVQVQDRQRAALPDLWQGVGAATSAEFLRRHSDASATLAAALHTAREAMEALREQLWEAVDDKVGAVIEIEGRAATTRTDWSAAAATVTSGVGDRSTAGELVDHAVKPFVDSVIRTDWLAAMRTAMSSVTTAYRQATGDIAGARLADFAIPGDLGPVWSAPTPPSGDWPDEEPRSVASMPAPAPAPAPVVGSAGGVTAPAVPAPATVPAAWPAPAPADMSPAPAEAAPPAMPSLGSAGPALPGLGGGGGLSGLGQPFADALTGLLGGGGGLPDPPPLDVPELDDPVDTVELEDDAHEDDEDDEDPEGDAGEDPAEDLDENPEGEPEEEPGEGAAGEPMPAPTPPPPPPPPAEPLPPVAETEVDERTPCEIAADELPQVGEAQPSEPGGG